MAKFLQPVVLERRRQALELAIGLSGEPGSTKMPMWPTA